MSPWPVLPHRGRPDAAFRFDPPQLSLPEELLWLLAAAFGPDDQMPLRAGDPARIFQLAERFDLSPRLVHRIGRPRLSQILGRDAADQLDRSFHEAAGLAVHLVGLLHLAAGSAAREKIPIALLKFAALDLGGYAPTGSRSASDIDILVPLEGAKDFQRALVRDGWVEADQPSHEHQLRPLLHPTGASAEIHTIVLGVRIEGRRSATFRSLERLELLTPTVELPGVSCIPVPDILIAHTLAHTLAQHGMAPRSYPLFRMAADLIALDARSLGQERLDQVRRWLSESLSRAEIDAAIGLAESLRNGTIASLKPESLPAKLVRHFVAGVLDDAYDLGLRRARLSHPLTDQNPLSEFLLSTRKALWPTREQMERIYGPSPSRRRSLLRRLLRPMDLLVRVVRRR